MPLATMSDPSIAQSAARGFLAGSSFTLPLRRLVPSLNASHLPVESITTVWPFTSSAGLALPLAMWDISSQVPTSFFKSFSSSPVADQGDAAVAWPVVGGLPRSSRDRARVRHGRLG